MRVYIRNSNGTVVNFSQIKKYGIGADGELWVKGYTDRKKHLAVGAKLIDAELERGERSLVVEVKK